MVDPDRLSAAFETARCDLLAESAPSGHWIGQLSSSAPATATAISALAIVERQAPTIGGRFADESREGRLSELIMASVHWLADHQNPDGGWGDTDKSPSNIAATMLVRSAFALTAVPADHPGILERADAYIKRQSGVRGLRRRYGRDKTLSAPILANAALAGLLPWRKVPALPFEIACLPRRLRTFLRLPGPSYTVPALVAVGHARYVHRKPWNPIAYFLRRRALEPSLRVLASMQSSSGGFLQAVPLTSFVVMNLAGSGQADHPVVRKGVEFLLASVRPDGSWPIATNLATHNTILAINSLAVAGEDVRELACLDWLLDCQYRHTHDVTGAQFSGWSCTDCSSAAPNTDDTSGALLALAAWVKAGVSTGDSQRIEVAVSAGVKWLLDLQNADGGWPTFSRGLAKGPFDGSGCDLTAHALRALHAWRTALVKISDHALELRSQLDAQIGAAIDRGFAYLCKRQDADGFWVPLWFGDQYRSDEENRVYGTSMVLAAYRDLGRLESPAVARALDWLTRAMRPDGSWSSTVDSLTQSNDAPSVEETALAVDALLSCGCAPVHEAAANKGLTWLIDAVEANRHQDCSPIGFHFARLWYYEKLYPLAWTVAALGRRARRRAIQPDAPAAIHSGKR